jgi:pyruvate/2-oxoglutarate dehydrogenase complex dihydrolipoamide dehydrogenase (E3) component
VARLPVASVLRAKTTGETRGLMKAPVAADADHLLAFTMLGAEAGAVVAVVQIAVPAGLPFTALRDAILTHPTMAEGLTVLFAGVPPQ